MSGPQGDSSPRQLLVQTLAFARDRKYTGYDYADGLSSRLLEALPVENRWLNLLVQETIKRAPVNVRPLFLVPQRQSYKGTALFAMANRRAAHLTGEAHYNREHEALIDWLVDHRARGYAGFCGGHRHALQDLDGRTEPGIPDVVSTAYAMRALLEAGGPASRHVELARSGAAFIVEDLGFESHGPGARVHYRPTDDGESYVLNANALAARALLDLYAVTGDDDHRRRAEALLAYVASKQTAAGGWMYTDPPTASHLSMDNHHNGFIVESLLRHRAVTGSDRFEGACHRGLSFYRETLFEPDGAPNWDESSAYPRDIHAAAQGIVSFTAAGDTAFARRILDWTVTHLYGGRGRFYYQQRRWYTKRMTLMRWCQAWMAYAIAVLLAGPEVGPAVHCAEPGRKESARSG
jgi:uncharacterized protein YyaL (SSP411 family)